MELSLLDTDIFSEILKGRNRSIQAMQDAYLSVFGRFSLSVVTVMDMVEGFHRRGQENKIRELQQRLFDDSHSLLPLDYKAAQIAGRIFADLDRTGQPIGRADPLIAAIAIRNSLVLVTGNTEHFDRIAQLGYNLRLDNWRTLTN